MPMPSLLSLTIEKLVPGGEGLARHEGRVVFVPGVIPGEEIRVEIVEAKKDFARGALREIIRPSPDRIAPPCPLAGTCGGCDWLHVDFPAQAKLKIEIVRDALRRMGGLEWRDLRIETGSPLGYRNRLQLHANGSGAVGFLERRGHGFVPVKSCPVASPAFAPLFLKGSSPHAPERFHAFGWNDAKNHPHLVREDEQPHAEAHVSILDCKLIFPVGGFFQSNLEMLERLIPYATRDLVGDTLLDLYSGVGLFASFLKHRFRRIVCVESSREALRFAARNVGTEKGVFLPGLLEQLVQQADLPLSFEQPDAAIVDPPREGLDLPRARVAKGTIDSQARLRFLQPRHLGARPEGSIGGAVCTRGFATVRFLPANEPYRSRGEAEAQEYLTIRDIYNRLVPCFHRLGDRENSKDGTARWNGNRSSQATSTPSVMNLPRARWKWSSTPAEFINTSISRKDCTSR